MIPQEMFTAKAEVDSTVAQGCISPIALVRVGGRKVNRRMDGNFVGWAWSWVEWEAQ